MTYGLLDIPHRLAAILPLPLAICHELLPEVIKLATRGEEQQDCMDGPGGELKHLFVQGP